MITVKRMNPFTTSLYLLAGIALTTSCIIAVSHANSLSPSLKQTLDADNISLQSILKPEQQKTEEAYAVGGIDSNSLERKYPPTSTANGNLWQVVFALLAVSAGAWWILNTPWFKGLAQQKEAQLIPKNGGYFPATGATPITTSSATTLTAPLQQGMDWLTSFLRLSPTSAVEPPVELALATVLQTLPLAGGQFLVMVKIGETIHSIVAGGHQPLLLGTWPATALGVSTESPPSVGVQTEKWMAQTPPTPTPIAKTEEYPATTTELLPDYEALNEAEEALFGQLLQTEKGSL
jgi:hypothetical protein